MTKFSNEKSVIKSIFIDATQKIENNAKNCITTILLECEEFMDITINANGNDEKRNALLPTKFAYLYDTQGAKNKLIMSPKMKNIALYMSKIIEHKDNAIAWASDSEKSNVSSLQGVYNAIKPKTVKTPKTTDDATDETTDETTETKTDTRSNDEVFKNFMLIWHKENRGDFWDYLGSLSDDKIASLMPTLKERKAS
jgi:hypothetical protein